MNQTACVGRDCSRMLGRLSLTVAVTLLGLGCAADADRTSEPPPQTPVWVLGTPKEEGIDVRVLEHADLEGITSLLVARHGRLVVERYYERTRPGDRLPIFSITKTVTSALIGVAIADGYVHGVGERLASVLPGSPDQVTLRELLTMTAGYGRGLNFQQTDAATLANRPLVNEPGTKFVYDSGSTDLLSAVLARATGMTAAEYARRRLFAPMGIRGVRWPSSRGASGLLLRARELLAFGQMYLDGGVWQGTRILPEAWVRTSTRAHVRVDPDQGIAVGYGYGWWVQDRQQHFFTAHGYLGQVLAVLPRLDEVVLVTSSRADGRTFELVRRVVNATHA
jgi:CubicO group peptidase (beta-lactamase class C family)